MDFALMFCPYCGGTVDSSDGERYLCLGCGKGIYSDRENMRAFIRSGELEGKYNDSLNALGDDNPKKALAIADEIQSMGDDGFDIHFLRGSIYANIGEDGKALIEWKKGLEMLTVYTNIDAYICLMAKSIADMIYLKEREYIEFSPISYIDKLCDEIYNNTRESCKSFFYYTIYRDYITLMYKLEDSGEETFMDVVPAIYRRVVGYHRNYWCLVRIIDEYLASAGYNADTYEDDDMYEYHIYDLMRMCFRRYIRCMTPDDMHRIIDHWDDVSLKQLEPEFNSLFKDKRDVQSIMSRILSFGAKEAAEDTSMTDDPMDAYVRKCLLLDVCQSEEPEMLE